MLVEKLIHFSLPARRPFCVSVLLFCWFVGFDVTVRLRQCVGVSCAVDQPVSRLTRDFPWGIMSILQRTVQVFANKMYFVKQNRLSVGNYHFCDRCSNQTWSGSHLIDHCTEIIIGFNSKYDRA